MAAPRAGPITAATGARSSGGQQRVDQWRLAQDEFADQVGVVERELQCDHAAGGVREYPGPFDPEAAQQVSGFGGVVGHRQWLGGCGVGVPGAGDADPAQAGDGRFAFERDEPVGEACCVDQHERFAVAAGIVVAHGDFSFVKVVNGWWVVRVVGQSA